MVAVVADTTGLTIPSWVILDDDDHVWVVITAHNSCGTNVDSIQINTSDDLLLTLLLVILLAVIS